MHGLISDGGNRADLLFTGIAHNRAELFALIDNQTDIGGHNQNKGDQEKIENLVFNTADHQIPYFFHRLPPFTLFPDSFPGSHPEAGSVPLQFQIHRGTDSCRVICPMSF